MTSTLQAAIRDETWGDLRKQVYAVAHRFVREKRIQPALVDDVLANAEYHYATAVASYRRDRGAEIGTHVVGKVRYGLLEDARAAARYGKEKTPVRFDRVPTRREADFDLPALLEAVGEDAREVVRVVLDSSLELWEMIGSGGNKSNNKRGRSVVRRTLENIGWTADRVREAFLEVAEALSA